MTAPIVTQELENINVNENAETISIDLFQYFEDAIQNCHR